MPSDFGVMGLSGTIYLSELKRKGLFFFAFETSFPTDFYLISSSSGLPPPSATLAFASVLGSLS